MRTWWSQYGSYVIGGIAVGALVLFGLTYYQNAEREAAYRASELYDALTDLVVEGDIDDAEAIAGEIDSDFGESNYAAQAKLAMARLYMDQNRDEDAAQSLEALLAMNVDEEFKHVARIRLAKVYLYQDRAQDAADLVEGRDDDAFAGRYAEVLGDAYVALDRPEDARDAYQRALLDNGRGSTVDTNFVQLKLMDLPAEPAEPADFFEPAGDDDAAVTDEAETAESGEATE